MATMSDPARIYFRDASYDGQLARTLSLAADGVADLGEAMAAARAVHKTAPSEWHAAWHATAERAQRLAVSAAEAGDRVTARDAYLRASEYYRQASFFMRSNIDDPLLRAAYSAHVGTFRAAIALFDRLARYITIPFEGGHLNGYLHSPDATATRRPTIIMPAGYDSTAESMFGVPDALGRGYNVLTFEGPGQGGVLYDQRIYFRPDTEVVFAPVVDWLLSQPEVDPDAIVLFGRSFGGYTAARAAAFEHRLAALVLDPAQPRMADRIPDGLVGMIAPHIVNAQMRLSDNRAEFFHSRMAAHNIDTIEDYFAELSRFDMLDVAGQIDCPTLIIEAEHDFAGGSGQLLKDAMTASTTLVNLTADMGADGHCAGLGQRVWAGVVYPWLQVTLADRNSEAAPTPIHASAPSAAAATADREPTTP
jgi:pimeloyl-ACP methyl ester carboxylesterase